MDDSDVYRLPYLDSGEPGFALLETARKYNPKEVQGKIAKGFLKGSGVDSAYECSMGASGPLFEAFGC